MTPATTVQPSDSPSDGPMNPIGIVKYWKLPRNQSGAWCQTLPCRSLSGIQSMDRTSMPRMPPPLPLLCARAGAQLPSGGPWALRFADEFDDAYAGNIMGLDPDKWSGRDHCCEQQSHNRDYHCELKLPADDDSSIINQECSQNYQRGNDIDHRLAQWNSV